MSSRASGGGGAIRGSVSAAPRRERSRSAAPASRLGAARPERDRICVARIGAPHGTGGEVRLWSFTAEPQAVSRYGTLETADGARSFEIAALRPTGDCFIARLKGVTDRSAAERLRNLELYVPRARLPVPQPDEFYHADLIGLVVEDGRGRAVGSVIAVHNFGAGDLLEIRLVEGGDTVMLPFTAAVVPQVEIGAGRMVLDPGAYPLADAAPREV